LVARRVNFPAERKRQIVIEIRQADIEDAVRLSSLLMANSSEGGGPLYGDWSIGVVTKWITSGAVIAIAIDDSKLIGVLFTFEKAQASAAPVVAMLRAWPGTADAYVYGPICIDESARGQGVLERLFAYVVGRLPGREAILFIKANNTRSLQAHAKLGMRQVANFELGGEVFIVLSSENAGRS
jgi:GNAT superfamily N-acetyltransferase